MGSVKKKTKNKGTLSRFFRFVLWICFAGILVAVLCGCVYTLYLTKLVEDRFSGRRWSVPSTVYSDSTVLYAGRGIDRGSFIEKLRRLGYRKSEDKRLVRGQWRNRSRSIDVFLHDLEVPWKKRKGFPVKIRIRDGKIAGIAHMKTGDALVVIELEPEEIMQFFGKERERRDLISIKNVPEHLVQAVLAAEDARFLLPNATKTNIVVTMNARELYHFFNLRCCNRAQWELREVATEMLRQVKKVAPTLFEKAGPSCVTLGFCPEGDLKPKECDIEAIKKKFEEL